MNEQETSLDYSFGVCRLCHRDTVLYKGLCNKCQCTEVPDFLQSLLYPKENNGKQ